MEDEEVGKLTMPHDFQGAHANGFPGGGEEPRKKNLGKGRG